MRPTSKEFMFVPDNELKRKWFDDLIGEDDKDQVLCVFDDRQKVVDMWRELGLTCMQVDKGDF